MLLDDFCEVENCVPDSPNELGIDEENAHQINQKWFGGETRALLALDERMWLELKAFEHGDYLPTQETDLISESKSLSPALRHGCLSVRKFYWTINDLYDSIYNETSKPRIVGQLIWREFFYTMSVDNINYGQMVDNPVCLKIPWNEDDKLLEVCSINFSGLKVIN